MLDHLQKSTRFDEKMFSHIFISMMVPFVCLPFVLWRDASSIAKYLNSWVKFEDSFLVVTKTPLNLKLKTLSLLWSSLAIVFPAICSQAVVFFPPYLNLWQCISCYLNVVLLVIILAYWRLNCLALCTAGEEISRFFKIGMKQSYIDPHVIRSYKYLWLQLRDLASELGCSSYRCMGFYLAVTLWFVTSSIYGSISTLKDGEYQRAQLFCVATIICGFPFYMICNGGHWVSYQIRQVMLGEVQKVSRMSTMNASALAEVNSFIQTVAASPSLVTLAGFVTVNRQLFLSAGGTLVTYLIVLLQIRISLE